MHLDSHGPPFPRPPRMPSTMPPPPDEAPTAPSPPTFAAPLDTELLHARLQQWARAGSSLAMLVASALVGAWWGFLRSGPAGALVLVQVEPERHGLDWRGQCQVNNPFARQVAESDPPEPVAVAVVGFLLQQLAGVEPGQLAQLRAAPALDATVTAEALRAALAAVETRPDSIVALYPLDTDDGPALVVLGAGYVVAIERQRQSPDAAVITLPTAPLASLILGRCAG